MSNPLAGIVPSHTKHLPVVPLAASRGAQPLSAICLRRPGGRHFSCAQLAAASIPGAIGEFNYTKNQHLDAKLRVDKYFEAEMTVQDGELDKYGVVNHVVYASYVDKAREELLLSLGISTGGIISSGNASMALTELNLKYFTPLRVCPTCQILLACRWRPSILTTYKQGINQSCHLIKACLQLVLDAITTTVVCLNTDYRPTHVFPKMSAKLRRFLSSKDG